MCIELSVTTQTCSLCTRVVSFIPTAGYPPRAPASCLQASRQKRYSKHFYSGYKYEVIITHRTNKKYNWLFVASWNATFQGTIKGMTWNMYSWQLNCQCFEWPTVLHYISGIILLAITSQHLCQLLIDQLILGNKACHNINDHLQFTVLIS